MLIYILLLIYIFFIGYIFRIKIKNRKYFLVLAFLVMALIVGFRSASVGEDTLMYIDVAKASKHLSWNEILLGFPKSTWSINEYGFSNKIDTLFLLLNKLIMTIFNQPHMVIIICSIFINALFAKFIYDNTDSVFLATIVYLCDSIFMMSFNGMRQCLAISLAIQSHKKFKEKQILKGVLWIISGGLIHQSALIYLLFIPFWFIKNKRKSLKYIFILAITLPNIITFIEKLVLIFSPYYASYLNTSFWSVSLGGTLLLWLFIIIIIIYLLLIKFNNDELYILIYYLLFYLSFEIIGMKFTTISRVALFFRTYLILFIPLSGKYMNKNKIYFYFTVFILFIFEFISYASSQSRIYSWFL
ncbi:EpsG family protein [Clostridium perfringens]|uniref:EpsG family protein n=1 Tax=Clostridium perfringens TaxID=1502 RepID=UPI00374F57C0